MSWLGEVKSEIVVSKPPSNQKITSLSMDDAVYMAECFGLNVSGDVKRTLKEYFNNQRKSKP
ncbi:hypothetical protein VPHK469_0158 [Vibrio phage K469]